MPSTASACCAIDTGYVVNGVQAARQITHTRLNRLSRLSRLHLYISSDHFIHLSISFDH
jgi:hypothetical protein